MRRGALVKEINAVKESARSDLNDQPLLPLPSRCDVKLDEGLREADPACQAAIKALSFRHVVRQKVHRSAVEQLEI